MTPPQSDYGCKSVAPQLDRIISTYEKDRAILKKRFTALYSWASILTFTGILLAVIANAFLPNGGGVAATAVAAGILIIAAILALAAVGSQSKYLSMSRPLSAWKDVRTGLRNAEFRYGNHRVFFGKYLVFRELRGDSVAVVDKTKPFSPFIAKDDAALTLKLDDDFAFAARLNEKNPGIKDFFVHPDYRYLDKRKPVYEKASLTIRNETNDSYRLQFDFGNANRRQFISLIQYLC